MTALTKGYKRYALILLTAVYALSFMDRIMMGILMESIKIELDLSDTQLGFLTGFAFALFYATLGIPIARWADRGNRVTIASLAIGVWGMMVMLCGFAGSFFQLLIGRIGAAVGEAGIFPPGYSLLGDYFKVSEHTRALSVFMAGISVSLIVSQLFAGWVNEGYGWRMAFWIAGAFGLVAALLIRLTLNEPRNSTVVAKPKPSPSLPLWVSVRNLWQIRTYRYLVLSCTLVEVAGIGFGQWVPVFYIRQYEMSTGELGIWLGLVGGTVGLLGTLIGGYIAEHFFSQNIRGLMNLFAVGVAVIFPCIVCMLLVDRKALSLLSFVFTTFLFLFFYGPSVALMQRLVRDDMRAIAAAFFSLVLNLIALGLGPQLVGIFSDLLSPTLGVRGLPVAMVTIATSVFGAAYYFWRAGQCADADLAAQERKETTILEEKDNLAAKKVDALAGI